MCPCIRCFCCSCDLNNQRPVPISQVLPPRGITLSEKCGRMHYLSFFFHCVIEIVKLPWWCSGPFCVYLRAPAQFVQLVICSTIPKKILHWLRHSNNWELKRKGKACLSFCCVLAFFIKYLIFIHMMVTWTPISCITKIPLIFKILLSLRSTCIRIGLFVGIFTFWSLNLKVPWNGNISLTANQLVIGNTQ